MEDPDVDDPIIPLPPTTYSISEEYCDNYFQGEDLGAYFFSLDCDFSDLEVGDVIVGKCIGEDRAVEKIIRDEVGGYWVLITEGLEL
jgi:hypothetical protein